MENTAIQWATHTFSPWRGCTKVSPGCANCYAACNMSVKLHGVGWGPRSPRVVKAESGWGEPLAWNRAAQAAGERHRVFCASLADVFEGADTMPAESWPVVQAARLRLLRLIYDTPHLDWLLLTKRPENIRPTLQAAYLQCAVAETGEGFNDWLRLWATNFTPPTNVWLGTSVENQEQADARIPHLLAAPAAVRFLSCEPLLAAVNLTRVDGNVGMCMVNALTGQQTDMGRPCRDVAHLDWVIVGGESGSKARPMHPQWAESLRDQCQAAGVAYFFKQWGEWGPTEAIYAMYPGKAIIPARLGYKLHNFTPGLIKRSMDDVENEQIIAWKLGKHAAGRLLDGHEYNEFPSPAAL